MPLPSFLQAMFTPQRMQGPGQMTWQNRHADDWEGTGEISAGDIQDMVWQPSAVTSQSVSGPTTRRLPDPLPGTGGGPNPLAQIGRDMKHLAGSGGDDDVDMTSISEVMETSAPIGNMAGGWADEGDVGMFTPSRGSFVGSGFTPTHPTGGDPGFYGTQDTSVTSPLIQQGSPIGEMAGGWADEGDPGAVGSNAGSAWLPQFEATQDDIGGPPIPEDSGINPLAAAGGVVGGAGLAASAPWWMKLLGKTFTPIGARAVPGYNLAGWGKYKDIAHLLGRGLKGVTGGAVGKLPTSTIGGALGRLSLPITAAMFFNEMRKNPQMHPGNLDPETTGTGAAVAAGQDLSGLPSGTEAAMRQARIPEIEIQKVLGENYVGPTL